MILPNENMPIDEFKEMLENHYETKDNPKKDILFRLAWSFGHAYGYHEVDFYYGELVDLIK